MMRLKLTLLFIILTGISVFAQKVKYKDLFILLKAENYEDADSYLRIFLGNEPDNANANYHMGKMLQSYMLEEDLLTSDSRIQELADSSILYFNNALNYLTEKEVKRHDDDYYAEFKRRDMRTGKFGVKYNDVQLEFENKRKEVEQYLGNVKRMNGFKSTAQIFYDSCQSVYLNFTRNSETLNIFFFSAGSEELEALRGIRTTFDSVQYNLNTYRAIMREMGKNAKVQELIFNEIKNYPDDGLTPTDLDVKEIVLWDYKGWANKVHDIIGKQIFPLKKRMVAYDEKLETLHNKIIEDSLDGRSEVFGLATQNVARDLKDYERNTLPEAIFNFRIAEINYHSMVHNWYKQVSDTLDVGVKIDFLADLGKQLASISKLLVKLNNANTDYNKKVFKDFINDRYENNKGMDAFVSEQISFVHSDSVDIKQWLLFVQEQDKHVIWHGDTIGLLEGTQVLNNDSARYSTFYLDSLSDREVGFYSWLQIDESFQLSYGKAPSSRQLDTLYIVEINDSIDHQALLANDYITDSLGIGQRIWIFNSVETEDTTGFPFNVFTTDLSNGNGWKTMIKLPQIAYSTQIDYDSDTVAILNEDEEIMVVLDSNGEIREESAESDEQ